MALDLVLRGGTEASIRAPAVV